MTIQDEAEAILAKPIEIENTFTIKTADKLDNSPVEWLVPEWIPKRGIVLLGADGGTGKTFVWVSILSSLSKGESTFLRYDPTITEEKTVLCISGEDAENILRSRLEKAGAKLQNVLCIAQDTETEEITFGSEFLENVIDKYRPAIAVFDPLQSFIGGNVDMSRRNQMRQALKPLAVLSSKYDMPVLIVLHTNKRSDADGRNKLADSSDIWDIARAVMMCGFTEDKERYISLEKSSYTDHMAVPTIIFNLDGGRVHFSGTTDKKMADFVAEKKQRNVDAEPKRSKQSECCDSILLILSDHADGYSSNTLDADLSELGYSTATIKRAKKELVEAGHITFSRNNGGMVTYFRKGAKEHQI